MKVDERLYEAAKELLGLHPEEAVAACYLEDGSILTGISCDSPHDQASLCAETGPICEAHKLKKKIVSSICISRDKNIPEKILIYSPCGICQERLFWFGEDVEVAIPGKDGSTQWESVPLKQVQPYWWKTVKLG